MGSVAHVQFQSKNQLGMLLDTRRRENLEVFKKAGMKIIKQRNYEHANKNKQLLSKYIVQDGRYELNVKDIMFSDSTEGVLAVSEVEDMNTGDLHDFHVNLKGSDIDMNRFSFLKELMATGFQKYLDRLSFQIESLENKLIEVGYEVSHSIQPKLQNSAGYLSITSEDHTLFLKIKEDEFGVQSVIVSNSLSWSNHSQNTSVTKGQVVNLLDFKEEKLMIDIADFFYQLKTDSLLVDTSYKQFADFSWI